MIGEKENSSPTKVGSKGEEKKMTWHDLQSYAYDTGSRSWRGPVSKVETLTKVTKTLKEKERLLEKQKEDQIALNVKAKCVDAVDFHTDSDSDAASVSDVYRKGLQ